MYGKYMKIGVCSDTAKQRLFREEDAVIIDSDLSWHVHYVVEKDRIGILDGMKWCIISKNMMRELQEISKVFDR